MKKLWSHRVGRPATIILSGWLFAMLIAAIIWLILGSETTMQYVDILLWTGIAILGFGFLSLVGGGSSVNSPRHHLAMSAGISTDDTMRQNRRSILDGFGVLLFSGAIGALTIATAMALEAMALEVWLK